MWKGGRWRARRRADRGECEKGRGVSEHGQVSPARSRPRVPALHTISAAPPDQDGTVRCPDLDARTRRRTSRGASLCSNTREPRVQNSPQKRLSSELGHVLPVQRSRYVTKDRVKRTRSTATSSACHVHPRARARSMELSFENGFLFYQLEKSAKTYLFIATPHSEKKRASHVKTFRAVWCAWPAQRADGGGSESTALIR